MFSRESKIKARAKKDFDNKSKCNHRLYNDFTECCDDCGQNKNVPVSMDECLETARLWAEYNLR